MVEIVRAPRTDEPPLDEEALFREARRLRRRRWARGLAVGVLLAAVGVAIAVLASSRSASTLTESGGNTAGRLPNGPFATLQLAGALAVGPTGAVYVADVARDRVLVRLADGRFRVVAGSGRVGFSGDGGPALRAELANVSELAFAPNGSLYIVDGGRVRVISRDGLIRTIAGNGIGLAGASPRIAGGTPALAAPLGADHQGPDSAEWLAIAFGPGGQLYVSIGSEIFRLSAAGTLTTIPAVIRAGSGPPAGNLDGFGPIAVDSHGNVDVAGVNGYDIWQLTANGVAHPVGFARRTPGTDSALERGPAGAVYGEDGQTILRVQAHRLVPVFDFNRLVIHGEWFWPADFAFGPHGVLYADETPGDAAYEAHQQLVAVRGSSVRLLWQERNRATADSFGPR
jgi:hypothetical protein